MNTFKLLRAFAFFFVTFLFIACSSDEDYTPSYDCAIQQFYFTSSNSGIVSDISGVISKTFAPDNLQQNPLILATVPENCDIANLVTSFSIHEKAKLYINNIEQTSGQAAVDYTNMVTAKVVAENGQEQTYDIVVKKGNPVIDNLVYTFMKTYSIPGISISVAKNDDIIYSYGYGFANVSTKERVTPNHLFRLASISKQFTTICIMKLYEEGKLDLDDTVFGTGGILEAEFPEVTTGSKAEVTIRQFLNHTSGWKSDPYDPQFDSPYKNYTLDQQIKYMLGTERTFSGSTNYSYYNLGFSILGKVIEKVTGKTYETYLKEVMALAGVADVHVGKDLAGKRSNECVYYSQNGYNGYGNNMPAIAAAGGVIASTAEMMKLIVQLDGKGTDILQKTTIDEMYTPSSNMDNAGNLLYALGWRVGHRLYPGAHSHSGNLAGTATIWCGDANNSISAAILMNSRSYITSGGNDFDDAYYILLGDIVAHFSN